jgi:transcription elongation factor GreA
MDKIPMTLRGYDRMQQELKQLKAVDRPTVIKAIAEAREHGDLSENAEYHAAREKQGFIEGRIMELEDKISRADVIDPAKLSGTTIKFGATVVLIDEDTDEQVTYQLVGPDEADIENGCLSISSPPGVCTSTKTPCCLPMRVRPSGDEIDRQPFSMSASSGPTS